MNPVAEEILSYYGSCEYSEDSLTHYGVKFRSGRYPWGSGEDPYQHGRDFLGRVEELKKNGWKETAENIKKEFGEHVSLEEYRNEKAWCVYERRLHDVETAKRLRDKEGLGATEIGRRMGKSESTIRSLLDDGAEERMQAAAKTADFLKKQVDEKKMIDVGVGTELELNVSRTKLDQALYKLAGEGYVIYGGGIKQPTNPGQQTNQLVLCAPGTKHSEIYKFENVKTINDYVSHDGGETFDKKFVYPKSMDSKRLMIRYSDDVGPDGAKGIDKDGIVELRRGVDDLSLGESRYAQVRILVDGTHYIKGMAVYSDNMPDGVDVVFNTNKEKGTPMTKVLKEIKKDPDNPFGSAIKSGVNDPDDPERKDGGQSYYYDKNGKKQLSLINKRADEGDWTEWKDSLPSQFLAKQSTTMIKKQLGIAKADKLAEYEEICSLTNPTIKKHLLKKFSDSCDSAAVHLQAAALPGQKYHVIIPVNTLKDTEVYAPGYENGTKLALIRYPHGGTFEIPILTVNNKNPLGNSIIGKTSIDAVGINKHNADRLSGADFDGDTVMCIPTHDRKGKVKVTSTDPLLGLEGFDPKIDYPERKGMKYMKDPVTGKDNTQKEMGVISNLITDMTLMGANSKELAAAVRHSMVVIDAGKHKLDYKRSEVENHIADLKKKYQIKVDENGNVKYGGASTLLSRASGEATVDKRQGSPRINIKGKKWYDPSKPEGAYLYKTADDLYYPVRKYDKTTKEITIDTVGGKKITYSASDKEAIDRYTPVKRVNKDTGEVTYTDKTGTIVYKTKKRTQKSTQMAEVDDALDLVSQARTAKEIMYADYANSMKALANQARKEMMTAGKIEFDSKAKATYSKEVDSLMAKLNNAELNKTRERAALRLANSEINRKKQSDETLSKGDLKKISQRAVEKYRSEVGSVSRRERAIDITDKEWEAIQAGAISESKLKRILDNADIDQLRQRATPRATTTVTPAKANRIKAMSASYTIEEIATKLGISTSTVSKYLKGGVN